MNTVKSIVALVIGLALFVINVYSAQRGQDTVNYKVEVTRTVETRSSAFKGGARHAFIGAYQIKNTGNTPIALNRLWFVANGMSEIYLEVGGNKLVQAHMFDVSTNDFLEGFDPKAVIVPGQTYTARIRADLREAGEYVDIANLRFVGLGIDDTGSWSLSVEHKNNMYVQHAIIENTPAVATVMSNSSGLARLENGNVFGFAVTGDKLTMTKVLVRVAGPALAEMGVSNVLADPILQVLDSKGQVVAESDDWAVGLEERFKEVGAFPFKRGSTDSATEAWLAPGSYIVRIKPFGGSLATGAYLVETYQLAETSSMGVVEKRPREFFGNGKG